MPQYGVLVYAPAPADPDALSAEYLAQLDRYSAQAEELGGKILGGSYFSGQRGFAFEPSTTATAVRGDAVTSGPLVESDLVASAFFVLRAPDLDAAVRIARLHPATRDGGVEVRPLFSAPAR
ncbi:MAG: hypothetical protein Kow00129_10480 [Thermoleophilia bacterium]